MNLKDAHLVALSKLAASPRPLGFHSMPFVVSPQTLKTLAGNGLIHVAITITDEGRKALAERLALAEHKQQRRDMAARLGRAPKAPKAPDHPIKTIPIMVPVADLKRRYG